MYHRRDLWRVRFVRPEAQDHVGRRFEILEVTPRLLEQNARREWPPVFAEFHGVVHPVAVLYKPGIGEYRSATQRPWAEFHPPLKPADHTISRQPIRGAAPPIDLPAAGRSILRENT